MRISRVLFSIVSLVALAACAKGAEDGAMTERESPGMLATAPDPAAVRRAIDSANAALTDAFSKGDAMALAAHYESDGAIMMPNGPAWKGRAAIEENGKGMFGEIALSDMKLTTEDVVVSGDLAVETGTYALKVTEKGGKAVPDNGKYIVVWRRQADGSWKIHRDIWNTDIALK